MQCEANVRLPAEDCQAHAPIGVAFRFTTAAQLNE
jgi:hypothetical protein